MSISRRKAGTFIECLRCGESTQVPTDDGSDDVNEAVKPRVATEPPVSTKPHSPDARTAPAEKSAVSPRASVSPPLATEPKPNGSSRSIKDAMPPAVVEEIFKDIEVEPPLASKPAVPVAPVPLPRLSSTSTPKPPDPSRVEPTPPESLNVDRTNSGLEAEAESSLDNFDELFDPIARDEHEDVLEELHRSTSTMILPEKPGEDSYVPDEIFQEEDDARPIQFRRKHVIDDEMDLTPMVDVTFQLLIFFMVSASFSLQKSIEVPTPDPESKGASQQVKTMDDLQGTSIVVKIDATNAIWLDDEPLGDSRRLADTLRDKMRHEQKTELLISASSQSLHRTVISVIDAANEIGVQKIRMSSSKKSD